MNHVPENPEIARKNQAAKSASKPLILSQLEPAPTPSHEKQ